MRKDKLIWVGAIFLVFIAFSINSNAAATKARTASLANGINSVVGIADISSGDTLEIDSSGNIAAQLKAGDNSVAIDANGNLAVEITNNTNTAVVDADGSLQVKEYFKQYVYETASGVAIDFLDLGYDDAIISTIIFRGLTAGDQLVIYDTNSATGTPEIDVSIASANETLVINIPGGIKFTEDVYISLCNATGTAVTTSNVTLVYDY